MGTPALDWRRSLWRVRGAPLACDARKHSTALLPAFAEFYWEPRRSLLLQSLLSEEYGLELRATQTALILVMAKGGIAAEQLFFSRLLATGATAGYFVPSVIVIMAIDAALLFLLFCWAIPNSGLTERRK